MKGNVISGAQGGGGVLSYGECYFRLQRSQQWMLDFDVPFDIFNVDGWIGGVLRVDG